MPSQIHSIGESEQPHQNVETQNPLLNTIPLEHSRSYQMEMYEASMKGNIIVVVRLCMGLPNKPF
jgi:GTP-dependent phosphoenolpyruvate carboxykinase